MPFLAPKYLKYMYDTFQSIHCERTKWKVIQAADTILIYFLKRKIINAVSLLQVLTKYTV
jgi:hypothetical protein